MTEAETGGADISRLAVAEACAGIVGRCFAACRVDGADMLTPDQLEISRPLPGYYAESTSGC